MREYAPQLVGVRHRGRGKNTPAPVASIRWTESYLTYVCYELDHTVLNLRNGHCTSVVLEVAVSLERNPSRDTLEVDLVELRDNARAQLTDLGNALQCQQR